MFSSRFPTLAKGQIPDRGERRQIRLSRKVERFLFPIGDGTQIFRVFAFVKVEFVCQGLGIEPFPALFDRFVNVPRAVLFRNLEILSLFRLSRLNFAPFPLTFAFLES